MAVELRTYAYLDAMQPQFTAFTSTVAKGYLPLSGQASLWIEIAPGMDINRVTDTAMKATDVQPGLLIVERAFGLLEFHSFDQGAVQEAGHAVLRGLELTEEMRYKPQIVSSETIKNISDYQCQLINRVRHGNMIIPGETLLTIETLPAGYAALAANEAEKASHINILEVRAVGAFGRVYIGGEEAEVLAAKEAAENVLETIEGKEIPKK
jgi:hypothetical protein